MLDKATRQEIKKLKKQKQFEEIYERFGTKAYVKSSPRMYMRKRIKELIKQGEYQKIKEKFGKAKYRAYLPLITRDKVYKRTGSRLKANAAYAAGKVLRFMPYVMLEALLMSGAFYGLNRSIYYENGRSNHEIIEQYNADVEQYAEYVRSLNLSQKEIIVKVISDIHQQYRFNYPQNDLFGYARIYLYENGYGVCRNMSDDFCAKLNAIDPSFKAHNVTCQLNEYDANGEEVVFDLMDNVHRRIDAHENEDVLSNRSSSQIDAIGNHMVSVITLKDETVPIVVDPTNPGMGAIYNGAICMFNAPENAISTRPLSTFLLTEQPLSVFSDYFESIENIKSFQELKEKYGPKALEAALERVKQIEAESSVKVEIDGISEKYKVNVDKPNNNRGEDRTTRKTNQEDLER